MWVNYYILHSLNISSNICFIKKSIYEIVYHYKYFKFQERERYKEPVRESLKALLALNWTVEHSETDVPLSHRGSTRRQSKPAVVSGDVRFVRMQSSA